MGRSIFKGFVSSTVSKAATALLSLTAITITVSNAHASTVTTKAAASVGSVHPVKQVDYLLFCNKPERMDESGVYAEAKLTGGKTYRIFFHYRNTSRATAPLVMTFHGSAGKPLGLEMRKGIAKPIIDPPLAGRQAMARYMKAPVQTFVGKDGGARFTVPLANWQVASGVVTVRTDQDARFRIYFKDAKRMIPGATVVPVAAPRREVAVSLKKDGKPVYYRIGVPEDNLRKRMDGTYGVVYAFRIQAPVGSRVRITFSPRGGHSGLVAALGSALFQSEIVDASQLVVFAEATVGRNGLVLTTIPFGGVFYPVEVAFHLI
jgi:hypothetical protein